MNDLQSAGLHRLWKRRLVQLAEVRRGDYALDVCCGTGDIAFALASKGASAVGMDFNAPMLSVAEARRERLISEKQNGGSGGDSGGKTLSLRFLEGDALQIPFPDNTFDIATVGYGLRNLVRWETGLSEMQRVLKPGGRLLALDFGKPDNALLRWVYFSYLRFLVPTLGAIVCRNPAAYAYILESLRHYPAQRGVDAELRGLGFVHVRIVNLLGGIMSINYGEKAGTTLESCR